MSDQIRQKHSEPDPETELLIVLAMSSALCDLDVTARRGDFGGILMRRRGRHVGVWLFRDGGYYWSSLASYDPVAFAATAQEALDLTAGMAVRSCWTEKP